MGLITLWKNYLPWTQAVVIAAHIARTKRFWLQTAWFLILVAMWIAFFVQSYDLIRSYLSYEKTTNIRLVHQKETPFPAVTFCNLNPFKKSMVHHSQELSNLLSAYTYVTKVKQAEMENATQSASAESSATSVAISEEKHRSKRQAVPPECVQASTGQSQGVPPGASSSQRYVVYNCSDGTGFIDFTSCDTMTVRSPRLPSTTILSNAETTKDVYYNCFHRMCADGCTIYTDGINAMITERGCIEGSDTTAIGLAAQTVATHCKYADSDCNMGAVAKPSNVYNGWCFSETCGYGLTMTCDDCTGGLLTYTHDVDPSCDTTAYISDMIPEVSNAMVGSDCGSACTPSPCQFDNQDPCQGLNYNRWLCAISMCNVSTTSWFTSTTTVAETSTTLISTTEPTSTSTIPETTTSALTSTTSALTSEASTTTEQVSSTTEALTTSTTTMDPTTTAETLTTTEPLTSTTNALSSSTTATPEATTTTSAKTTEISTATVVTTTDPTTTVEQASSPASSTISTAPETTTISQLPTTTGGPTTTEAVTTASETIITSTTTSTSLSSTTAPESTTKQQTTPTITQTTITTAEATTTVAIMSTDSVTTSTRPMETTFSSTLTAISTSTAREATTSNARVTSTEFSMSTEPFVSTTRDPSVATTVRTSASTTPATEPSTVGATSSSAGLLSSRASSTVVPKVTTTAYKTANTRSSMAETSLGLAGRSSTTVSEATTTAPSSLLSSVSTAQTSTAAAWKTTREGTTTMSSRKRSTSEQSPTSMATVEFTEKLPATLLTTEGVSTPASTARGSATRVDGTDTTKGVATSIITSGDPTDSGDGNATSLRPLGTISSQGSKSTSTPISTTKTSASSNLKSSTVDPSDLSVSSTVTLINTRRPSSAVETSTRSNGPEDGGNVHSTPSAGKTEWLSTTTARAVSSKSTSHRTSGGPTTADTRTGWEELGATTSVAKNPSTSPSSKLPNQGQWWSTSEKGRSTNRSTTANPTLILTSASSYSTKPSKTTTVASNASDYAQRTTTTGLPDFSITSKQDESDTTEPGDDESDTAKSRSTRKPGSDNERPTAIEDSENSANTTSSKDPRQISHKASTTPAVSTTLRTKPLLTSINSEDKDARTTEDGPGKGANTNPAAPQESRPTARPNGNGSENGKSRSTTPSTSNKSTHEGVNNGDGPSNLPLTAKSSDSDGREPTTTSYESHLKNIKLNLSSDFSLSDLTPDQKRDLEALSDAYGLDPNNDKVVIDAVMKQAMQIVAAKMSPELRQILGFQLKDLVSACIINGDPCEDSDFDQTFDVDYGNCYTFNYAQEPVKYIAKSCGTSHGLHMTIIANASEQLASSVESGVKVVVHDQNLAPFPNVEGFKSPTGQLASLISGFSRLGEPYGECSTLDSIEKEKQPFYFNGTYSTEGCFRSCFQRNLATACGCADSRFPAPTDMDVPFCDPLDPPKYQCKEAYIQENGDYYFVDNCDCYDACEDATYRTQISEAVWPSGTFFYGGFCPSAKQLNSADCTRFYSENGMTLEVSFAQLGYESLEEEPASTAWDLVNNLAGNTGLWIGYTMLSFTECVLIAIQVALWVCRCPKELPEVPSCRHRNFFAEEDEDSNSDESSDEHDATTSGSHASSAGGFGGKQEETFDSLWSENGMGSVVAPTRLPPKNFDNSIHEKMLSRREVRAAMPSSLELYDRKEQIENVEPIAAHSTDYANPVTHE